MPILAYPFPVYQPALRIISDITNSNPAIVTTSFNHQYINGAIVRLNIPLGFGMVQANQLYGPIIVTGNTTFTIDIDTTFFDPFMVPESYPNSYQSAQCTPVGEINETLKSAVQNVLPYSAQ
jgi:hypothetical protein